MTDNTVTKKKRNRSKDFTDEEVKTIVKMFYENNHILTGALGPSLTQKDKDNIYQNIKVRVNSIAPCERSLSSIIQKWQNLRKNLKTKVANFYADKRKDIRKTGGGEGNPDVTSDEPDLDDIEKMIFDTLPQESVTGMPLAVLIF